MKKRIGITGGTGFIGQYLIRDYSDKYDFVAATSGDSAIGAGVKYCHTDYSTDSLKEIFQSCEAIVHLGSKVPDSVTAFDPIEPYLENVTATDRLLRAAVDLNIGHIVFTSSVSVYEKSNDRPLAEDAVCRPDNAYGVSKAATEMLLWLYAKQYGIRPVILRVSQVLGYREYKNPGFFGMLQDNSFKGNAITLYGEGKACRDYIYVKDVCSAIDCSLQRPSVCGTYNIGSGKPTSNLALAEAYCATFDNKAGITHVPFEKEDTRHWYMDIQRARDELGWQPMYDTIGMVADIRSEMLQAYVKRG